MKVLHTSDWHLGKYLEKANRIEEQKLFIDEITDIVNLEKIDLVLISGDIYDKALPSTEAEGLFYEAIIKLTDNGKRPVVIISGNHDSPKKLSASNPVIKEVGVIMVDSANTVIEKKDNEYYQIIDSGRGYFELKIKEESIIIINMPYPSEKRLNEIITEQNEEELMQKDYSEKIGSIYKELSGKYRKDTINIATGHFFIRGGEESASERNIQLGGSLAISAEDLPKDAQYIAMGHLHRPQKVKGVENTYYSGSPLEYSRSEIGYSKSVYIIELKPASKAIVNKILLKKYKPIEVWKAKDIEEAIKMCEDHRDENTWVYLDIKTDRVIEPTELKEIHSLKKDILQINAILPNDEKEDVYEREDYTLEEDFENFYKHINGVEPSNELMEVFLDIYGKVSAEKGCE